MSSLLKTTTLIFALAALAGCASTGPFQTKDSTGFLADYSQLTPIERPSGTEEWRWSNPSMPEEAFSKLTLKPIQFYPEPKTQDQVSLLALNTAREMIDNGLINLATSRNLLLYADAQPGGVTLESAITTVETQLEDMKIRELIPKRMVISGAQLALGYRDQEVTVLLEYRIIDNDSGKVIIRGVRKGKPRPLDDDKEQLSREHLQQMVEQLITDLKTDLPSTTPPKVT